MVKIDLGDVDKSPSFKQKKNRQNVSLALLLKDLSL